MEVDGTDCIAIQPGVEEFLGILYLSTFGEGQPHSIFDAYLLHIRFHHETKRGLPMAWKVFSTSLLPLRAGQLS